MTIVCHRSEMGQGIRSSLPVLIADELGAQMARVKIVQADGDKAYGDQNTDGSNSIRGIYEDMRRVGATARVMLVATAAKRWNVRAEDCVARDHAVTHLPTGRALGFGELALEAGKQKVPAAKDVALRPVSELPHLGKPLPLLDGPAYVTGQAIYGADIKIPGMLTAVIARPPVVGGKVARFDADASVGGSRRSQSDRDPAAEAAVRVPAMGRRRGGGGSHVGGHAWTSRARRDLGSRPERQLRFGPVSRRPRQGGGGPRNGRPQSGRCGGGAEERGTSRRGRVPRAAPAAHADGAASSPWHTSAATAARCGLRRRTRKPRRRKSLGCSA